MVASVAPVWDGNETWLVFGALGLLAAFPLAYAIIIPAVYFPVAIMLLALIFRGVAFEYRYRDSPHRQFWDHGFEIGSLVATFAQGIVLGAFIQGFQTDGRAFTGSSLDCFSPFSIVTGICLVFGYALLGAGWLVLKTEGALHAWARRCGRFALGGVCVGLLVVSVWTPIMEADMAQRWFSWPNVLLLSPVPLITALLVFATWRALNRASAGFGPYAGAVGLFAMSYLGLGISLWPMVVPHRFTLWQAAANPSTQAFLLVGTLFLLPVILMYIGLVVLGVPRQGARGYRVSLSPRPCHGRRRPVTHVFSFVLRVTPNPADDAAFSRSWRAPVNNRQPRSVLVDL